MTTAQGPVALVRKARDTLDAIPFSALILVARIATFSVFFRSGLVKISDWSSTLLLFQNEYHVPVLPPELAAYLAAGMELGASTLVLLGLFTRVSTLGLMGMIAVIQLFVYPQAWPDHIQWLGFMVFIVARGPGRISLDHVLGQIWGRQRAAPARA
ncbi:MAG: DoxX family protein [Caulobacteraceae bacterium]